MIEITRHQWPDLRGITATTARPFPEVQHCTIKVKQSEQLQFQLLPRGMYSIFSHTLGTTPDSSAVAALSRMVARHVWSVPAASYPHSLSWHVKRIAIEGDPLQWPDLPGVAAWESRIHERVAEYGFCSGDQEAVLFLTCHTLTQVGWARLSAANLSHELLVSLGRTLLRHHDLSR